MFALEMTPGQYGLVSFCCAVLLLTVPPCPAICKSGRHVPPVIEHLSVWQLCRYERDFWSADSQPVCVCEKGRPN